MQVAAYSFMPKPASAFLQANEVITQDSLAKRWYVVWQTSAHCDDMYPSAACGFARSESRAHVTTSPAMHMDFPAIDAGQTEGKSLITRLPKDPDSQSHFL